MYGDTGGGFQSGGMEYGGGGAAGGFGGMDPMMGGGGGGFAGAGVGGAGGEGGFLGAQQQGGAGGQAGGTERRRETLVPLTIKMVQEASGSPEESLAKADPSGAAAAAASGMEPGASNGDSLYVDGHEVHEIAVVGQILSVTELPTVTQFVITDGTGRFTVQYWVQSGADEGSGGSAGLPPDMQQQGNALDEAGMEAEKRAQCVEGRFVKCIGKIRESGSGGLARHLNAYNILPVNDYNLITHHFLDVIYVHLYRIKGVAATQTAEALKAQATASSSSGAAGGGFMGQGGGFNGMQPSMGMGGMGMGGMGMGGMGMGGMGMQPQQQHQGGYQQMNQAQAQLGGEVQNLVYRVIKSAHGEQGTSIDNVLQSVQREIPNATMDMVRSSAEFLSSEGMIYTTVNDNYFRSTEADT